MCNTYTNGYNVWQRLITERSGESTNKVFQGWYYAYILMKLWLFPNMKNITDIIVLFYIVLGKDPQTNWYLSYDSICSEIGASG